MSSIIKVDTIQDQDGNNIINENSNTITIGQVVIPLLLHQVHLNQGLGELVQ